MKKYKLLKNLPTFNAGDIFVLKDDGCLYLTEPCDFSNHWKHNVMAYHRRTLKNFPRILEDWFEEIATPKEYWYIADRGVVEHASDENDPFDKGHKEMGNYFETKEEAEKAVRKLKAWKRLKDNGFRFTGCSSPSDKGMCICYETDIETWSMQDLQDFKVLFGGGE